MKNLFLIHLAVAALSIAACDNSSHQVNTNKDSSNSIAVDCMPIVNPVVRDSAAVVKTPPSIDSMAVTQDSLRRHR